MPVETQARRNALSYYHEIYHHEHFGGLISDDAGYRLLSLFWRYALFERNGLNVHGKVLDFGSGVGQVSAALPDTLCYDFSPSAINELRKRGRLVAENRSDIPRASFDYILNSHCLEHSPTPFEDLKELRAYVRTSGQMILVLPIEVNLRPALQSDWNLHLFAWTFQTATNLLLSSGWTPMFQSVIYNPFLLRTLGKRLPADSAVRMAHTLGRIKRGTPAMLTIAQPSP